MHVMVLPAQAVVLGCTVRDLVVQPVRVEDRYMVDPGSGLSELTGQGGSDVQYQYGAGGFGTPRQNTSNSMGGHGALRIIWGGGNRAFPSTNVGLSSNDETVN